MDKKSQTLIVLFALAFTASVVASFYRYVVLGNFAYATDEAAFQEAQAEAQ